MNVPSEIKLTQWYMDPVQSFRDFFDSEPYPYQARILRDLKTLDMNRIMSLSAAGTGKTKLWAGVALWGATALSYELKRPYDVIIISGSADQSRYLYEYSRAAIETNKILASLVSGEPLKSLTSFTLGSSIKALANSMKAIQGVHAPFVIVDEAAIAGDFVIKDTKRIVSPYTQDRIDRIALSGTPMDYLSLYVDMWDDKEQYPEWEEGKANPPNTWKRYSWSALDCPNISKDAFEEARLGDPEVFEIFWLGKPYPITNTVVPVDRIRKASDGVQRIPPDFSEDVTPPMLGVDWGWKQPTVAIVSQKMDDTWYVLEDIQWKRQEYTDVHEWVEALAIQNRVGHIRCDLNPKGESQRLEQRPLPVTSVAMNVDRPYLMSHMRNLFLDGKIKIPEEFVELLYQLKRYQWDTKEGDDHVVALMLSLREIETYAQATKKVFTGKIRRRTI